MCCYPMHTVACMCWVAPLVDLFNDMQPEECLLRWGILGSELAQVSHLFSPKLEARTCSVPSRGRIGSVFRMDNAPLCPGVVSVAVLLVSLSLKLQTNRVMSQACLEKVWL